MITQKVNSVYKPVLATPAVRHLLKKHNIHPDLVKATGKDGRIIKEDVLNYINKTVPGNNAQEHKTIKEQPKTEYVQDKHTSSAIGLGSDQVVKLVGFQKAMTKTMSQAADIPSFLFTDEINVDKLVKLRKDINKIQGNKLKITYMPFLIKAVSLALNEYPTLNSHTNPKKGEDGYIYEYTIKRDHNISVAIDGPDGLVVPNIKRVQDKTIVQIQKELYSLREKTENRKLTNEDLKDGTFTLSNIGNIYDIIYR